MERYLIVFALSLLTNVAHADRCEKNSRHKDEKRCQNVYCDSYAFSKCVSEYCCSWLVEFEGEDVGEVWLEPGEGA